MEKDERTENAEDEDLQDWIEVLDLATREIEESCLAAIQNDRKDRLSKKLSRMMTLVKLAVKHIKRGK